MTPIAEATKINVLKRDGESEPLDINKIHKMVELACEGLAGVSESHIEVNANLQFFDGIKSSDIQEILIRSANDLIDLESPNYQYVAARLLLFSLRKSVYGDHPDNHPTILSHVKKCAENGVYDPLILDKYTEEEWGILEGYIDHDRDYLFTYAGIRQVADKYLVQCRTTGLTYETPQFMYMMVALTLFQDDDKFYRLEYVRKYYDAISKHKLNIPTPIMAGVRTPIRQFASCVLVDVDDTLDSIFSSDMAIGKYVAQRAGIGINAGRIRGINSKIRSGEVQHTGVVPFLKKFESTVRCCTQNGIRGGSATVHFPLWHQEIEDIIVLKNNKGTADNRVRKLDYSIQISKLFYERFIQNGEITLPTDPIQHIDGSGEIALCILSAINVGKINRLDELDELCELAVRGLDALIDYQNYPVNAAKDSTLNRRSLGIGYIGLAHYLAKNNAKYDSQKAHDLVHKLTERFQYALLSTSNRLAMEKGPCGYFGRTKYADGILPIDTYKKEVDEIVSNDLQCDWEHLRNRIKQHGLRHSTLSAQMPSESSSVVSNATNGIEPPRDYLSVKKSKKGPLKQIVPSYGTLKNNYTLLWDMHNNDGYIKVTAVMQKFFDQAISGNWSYNPENYSDNEVPVSEMAKDLLNTYKYGWKTSYYHNTYDIKKDGDDEPQNVDQLINKLLTTEEDDCDSCKV